MRSAPEALEPRCDNIASNGSMFIYTGLLASTEHSNNETPVLLSSSLFQAGCTT